MDGCRLVSRCRVFFGCGNAASTRQNGGTQVGWIENNWYRSGIFLNHRKYMNATNEYCILDTYLFENDRWSDDAYPTHCHRYVLMLGVLWIATIIGFRCWKWLFFFWEKLFRHSIDPSNNWHVGLSAFRYCYHFGVAAWLREHMMPEDLTTEAGTGSGQDGRKSADEWVWVPNKTSEYP